MFKATSLLNGFGVITIACLLTACSGAGQSGTAITPQGPNGASQGRHTKSLGSPCITITDSTGTPYTVAQTGGGDHINVSYSSNPCQVGIYISPANGPASLDHTAVTGPYGIGVYVDSVNNVHIDHTAVCVNGNDGNYNCVPGSGSSLGTGIDFLNSPNIQEDHTSIDGYAAGWATNPCPNPKNNINDDHTTITNYQAGDAWSFMGGHNNIQHASPVPPAGGSCNGSGVGPSSALYGDATFVQPGSDSLNGVQMVWDGGAGNQAYGGIAFNTPPGLTIATLNLLSTDYKLTTGTCEESSPRFQVNVVKGGHTHNIFIYLGPQFPNTALVPCAGPTYMNSGNTLSAPGYGADATQIGDSYTTWAALQTGPDSGLPITGIQIVVDGYSSPVTAVADNIQINGTNYSY